MRAMDPAIGFCYRHSLRPQDGLTKLDDSLDLRSEIFAQQEGAYDSPESINSILSNIVDLVAAGRLSTRRAAVITYALSLMLRSAVVAERQALEQLPLNYVPGRHNWQDDAHESQPDSTTGKPPFTPPTTPEEAIAAYERLRS